MTAITKTKSLKTWTTTAVTTAVCAVIGALATPTAFAEEKNIGKHSQAEIRSACNAAGGQLLGVSDLGSYGCEVASKGTMILCNKDQDCTGYTPARTKSDRKKVLANLNLGVKTAAK